MKILVSTSLLSPYRVDWLNELGKYEEVTILYLEEENNERNREWLEKKPENCKYKLMKGVSLPKIGKISLDVLRELKRKKYDIIILDGYGYVTQLINIFFLNKKKEMYFINVDGAVPKRNEKQIVRLLKKAFLSKVPYFLCGSYETGNILVGYGSNLKRIIHHPFTSLYKRDIYKDVISFSDKISLRKKLEIKEKYMVISVGRFSYLNGYGKGYDVLLKAAERLKKLDIGWYIIGGEPTDEFAKMKKEMKLENVHFVDFKKKEELKEYYRAADIFTLMTVGDVWGLVINEAMACGLPVITTDRCVAGVELVENGVNGYIIPVADTQSLVNHVQKILETDGMVEKMGHHSLEKIQDYTIENMVRIHISKFKEILNNMVILN